MDFSRCCKCAFVACLIIPFCGDISFQIVLNTSFVVLISFCIILFKQHPCSITYYFPDTYVYILYIKYPIVLAKKYVTKIHINISIHRFSFNLFPTENEYKIKRITSVIYLLLLYRHLFLQ